MDVDLPALYRILSNIAAAHGEPITYGQLSQTYEQWTDQRVDPHVGWSLPLLAVLEWCAANGLPPLSALVVSERTGIPGHGFWGQVNTPPTASIEAWVPMTQAIYAAEWPQAMN